jgi:hypothetical protein
MVGRPDGVGATVGDGEGEAVGVGESVGEGVAAAVGDGEGVGVAHIALISVRVTVTDSQPVEQVSWNVLPGAAARTGAAKLNRSASGRATMVLLSRARWPGYSGM